MAIDNYIILSDQQLIVLAGDGDSQAFEALFNRYRDAIHKLYLQRTGNVEDADDLLQETFVKVFLNLEKYDTAFTFGQWVYTIARNAFIDHVRKRRDDLSIEMLPSGGQLTSNSMEASPEERYINSQRGAQLQDHLSRLSPRYRKLIELRFFMEYSYEEIASHLDLPMGTVKTQIHRAREQLCKLITESDIL